jgi:hypothetical protein
MIRMIGMDGMGGGQGADVTPVKSATLRLRLFHRAGMSENWGMIWMIRMGGRAEKIVFETRSFVRYESRAVGW